MAKPALLTTGPMMSLIEEGIDKAFIVHRLQEASDREALLKKVGPDIRAICTGSHTGVKTDAAMMAPLPQPEDHRQLRRRLRFGRRGGGRQARRHHHQHARRADRGGGRHRAGAAARARCASSTTAEKWLRDGRWAKEGDYRLTAGLAARPLDRHGRLRPHRQGDRAAHRGVRPCRSAISRATRRPGVANRYYSDLVAMARDVDTLIAILPGGPATAEHHQRGGARRAGAARHPHQHGARLGGRRGGADRGAQGPEDPGRRPRRLRRASPTSTRRSSTLDNVTLFPHVGSASIHTRNAMGQLVVDNLAAFADGKPPKTPVPETPFKGW